MDKDIYPNKWPIIIILWLFAIGVVLFWVSFFWGGAVHTSDNACYVVFEQSFVAADLVTVLFGLICAEGLRRDKHWATVFGGVTAGGIVFLLCMDMSWNLSNNQYTDFSAAMIIENLINIFCITFAPYLIWYLIRCQRQFVNV